jgi:hypothetical protein
MAAHESPLTTVWYPSQFAAVPVSVEPTLVTVVVVVVVAEPLTQYAYPRTKKVFVEACSIRRWIMDAVRIH